MKICIFGAGAIGGYMGAKLAQAGAEVSLVARGPHLAAMRENGLTLIEEGERTTVPVTASDNAADLGPQDYVIVTLKAHSVPGVVDKMQPLIGTGHHDRQRRERRAVVVFPQAGRPLEGTRLAIGRSRQHAVGRLRPRPGAGLRRLSGGRGDRAGRDQAYRGQPVFAGRT